MQMTFFRFLIEVKGALLHQCGLKLFLKPGLFFCIDSAANAVVSPSY